MRMLQCRNWHWDISLCRFCALLANAIFVSFLNRFYTDILGMKGLFITMLPLVSTVFVIIGNLKMGTMIDKTHTKAGKARPYLLISAPLMLLSIFLIFSVPTGNDSGQLCWIAISYNLFFAVAYPAYFVAHSMMIPLSTRKSNQRGKLSIASQVANLGSTGLFATMLFPTLLYPLSEESEGMADLYGNDRCYCLCGNQRLNSFLPENGLRKNLMWKMRKKQEKRCP